MEEVAQNNDVENGEFQLNNNTQASSAARATSTEPTTDVASTSEEKENCDDGTGHDDDDSKADNNNNNTITHDEEQQQQQQQQQQQPTTPTTPTHVAIGIPLTRVYLAGIPPAKPYRRVTYTEWSPLPSSSSSSSSPSFVSFPDYKEVEKKVKTLKCQMISCLLSIACYTFCFLIVPILVYICYVIYYAVQQNQDTGDEAQDPLPNGNAPPVSQDEIEEAIPCPYLLQMRDQC